jgi:hypothetical protein
MKIFMGSFCALLVAGSAFAQNYSIAKQQARNAAAREAQNQQAINPTPPTAQVAPPPANPQPNPALEATLRNIANLRADFERLGSNPTNRQPLINDLTAAAQGTKAKPASVSTLAESLAVVAGNKKLPAQHQKLAQNIHAIFNSSHLSAAQQQQVLDGVQKTLLDGGVSADDTAKVISNLKTIASETK